MDKLIIEKHSVHLWRAFVPDLLPQINHFFSVLSNDEIARAQRFHFEKHRQRYIIARGILRYILSLYLAMPARDIVFILGDRGKPYLQNNYLNLQFNVSHSHDMAVYAITTTAEIGIDIEKIKPPFNDGVARKFFSLQEYAALAALPEPEKIPAFYRCWAGKEAIIKALGAGLYAPLAEFSLDLARETQTVELPHQGKYYLKNFIAHTDYQAAFAASEQMTHLVSWMWDKSGPIRIT